MLGKTADSARKPKGCERNLTRTSGNVRINCLDTTALIDYLHGDEAIAEYLEHNEPLPLFVPTVALQRYSPARADCGAVTALKRPAMTSIGSNHWNSPPTGQLKLHW